MGVRLVRRSINWEFPNCVSFTFKGREAMTNPSYLTVHALTKYIKRKFDVDPHLMNVFVKGEISNFKRHTSGHLYFTLKDEKARIMSVMFSKAAASMKFIPENGMKVLIKGYISVYEQSGQYQIYVQEMLPDGIGELFLAFEQLKVRLESEGLFRPDIKKTIPKYPKRIGIITSPTGAAIRDIITTVKRRYPIGEMIIIPVLVQGKQAAHSIAEAIVKANDQSVADVLIVGRGGGSIEELWAFNEEPVARAIFHSHIPIISAVGHETDFTIADFVADLRAPTPTGAAELAVPHLEELMERLLNLKNRLFRGMAEKTREKRSKLNYLEQAYIFRNPHKIYEQKWESVDKNIDKLRRAFERNLQQKMDKLQMVQKSLDSHHPLMKIKLSKEKHRLLKQKLIHHMQFVLKNKTNYFTNKVAQLEAYSPLNTLQRGFSVAYMEDGTLLKNTETTNIGDKVIVQVTDGRLHCIVNQIEKGEEDGGKTNI